MPLSEQELKALREIEAQLYADDPAFGGKPQGMGSIGPKAIALGLVGLCLLIGGMALVTLNSYFMVLSVVGFIIMFGTGIWVLRGGGKDDAAAPTVSSLTGQGRHGLARPARGGNITGRMEENFRKRFEN